MSRLPSSRRAGAWLRQEDGQSLVEFALLLPLLLLVLFGIVDLAKAYNYWNDSTHLANVGARYAAVGNVPGGNLSTYLKSQAETTELGNQLSITICSPTGTYAVGEPIKVVITSTYTFLPLVASKVGPTTTIKSSATNRVERATLTGTDVPQATCPA
jgi:Flp pilus assembly protein TadG